MRKMISCKEYVETEKQRIKEKVVTFNTKPLLAVIQVDSDSASNSYIAGKKKDCAEVGIECLHLTIDSSKCSQEELEVVIKDLNNTKNCNGIIIQLPIPKKYDIDKLQQCISPQKDVDGFRRDSCFEPCTPKGIIDWLDYNEYLLEGKNVVVLGRSKIVGKPLVNMLIDKGATVTSCNSKTRSINSHTYNADVIISAVGKPKFLSSSNFWNPDIVIDVGINRDENGKLCGDIDRENVEKYCDAYVTPVPGSVGLLTRMILLKNVIKAYEEFSENKSIFVLAHK